MLGMLNLQNPMLNFQEIRRKQQKKVIVDDKQKLMPKGACCLQQAHKYEYIKNFISNPSFDKYIIPINHNFAPFVVVKKVNENQSYPIYELYYQPTKVFLLAAQEQSLNIGCNYIISKEKKPQKNSGFIAKLRGNFSRKQFSIYDNGNNPNKDKKNQRRQYAFIKIEPDQTNNLEPYTTILVPKPRESLHEINQIHQYQLCQFPCSTNNENPLLKAHETGSSTIEKLQLKQKNNQSSKSLNLAKKYTIETSLPTTSLMISKKSPNIYQLEIGCPLSIVQGFGFLLSLLQAQAL